MSSLSRLKQWIISLLRRTERMTGTDNVYVAKNTTYLILNQAISVLNGFVLYILIARFLPQDIYGQYKYFLSLFSLFAIAGLTGTETALIRSVAQGKEGSLRTAFRLKFNWSLIGSAISLIGAGYYLFQQRHDLAIALILLAIFSPLIYASNVYAAFLSGRKAFDRYTQYTILSTLISFVGMAVSFIFVRNPVTLFALFLLTSLPSVLLYILSQRRVQNQEADSTLPSYSRYLSLLDIFGIVATNIDSVIVFHFLGATNLAVYSLAIIPVEQLKGFLKAFQSIAFPKFAIRTLKEIKQRLNRIILLFIGFLLAMTAAYILLIGPFFHLFFPRYAASIPYTQIAALSLVFVVPSTLLISLFQAKTLKKETALFSTISYTIQIALVFVLTWKYGLWGAIWSRVIARACMFTLAYGMFARAKEETV